MACDGGDPAACVVALDHHPLSTDKLTAKESNSSECRDVALPCARFAAHLWSGLGVKAQQDAALAEWKDDCFGDGGDHSASCLAYAKAIERTSPSDAVQIYRDQCQDKASELACKAAARMWSRVHASVDGMRFTVELPGVMRQFSDWGEGAWHVAWSNTTMHPDVFITVRDGKLDCRAGVPAHDGVAKIAGLGPAYWAAYAKFLATGWGKRICDSLQR